MNSDNIDIFLSSDENYVYPLGVCLVSILENNSSVFDNINFHILSNGIKKESIDKINSLKDKYYNCNFTFYDIETIKNIFPKGFEDTAIFKRFSFSAYGRLFIVSFLKERGFSNLNKILYLDCDIIVDKSLKNLWDINIDNYYLAAVIAPYNDAKHVLRHVLRKTTSFNSNLYFNSGVLLINLKKWRLENVEDKFINIMKEYYIADQDILNLVLARNTMFIDLKYNTAPEIFYIPYKKYLNIQNIKSNESNCSHKEFLDAFKNPVIIHYLGGEGSAPFRDNCIHPKREKFEYYKKLSPWKDNLPFKSQSSLVYLKLRRFMIIYFPTWILKPLLRFRRSISKYVSDCYPKKIKK